MIAFLDLPSGLSGDMLLGCLIDVGWSVDALRSVLAQLNMPPDAWSVEVRDVMKGPLRAAQVSVHVAEDHHHRGLSQVCQIIDDAELSTPIKDRARAIFQRLAHAEAKVHGTTPDKIHFHEVGALDAIVDIVGAVSGLKALHIETLYASAAPLSNGWVDSEHGRLPLPAPATLELLAAVGAPAQPGPGPGEWVTPTAAALLAELAQFEQPAMQLQRVGMGAGQRDCDWPNVARIWYGEHLAQGPMIQLDTNIDDMNPQLYSAVSDRLFAAGAHDVWLTPVQMKKGRPGVVLSVLAPTSCQSQLCDLILRETTTLGLRIHSVQRHEARREMQEVQTPYGAVGVKLKWADDDLVGVAPEYDECRTLAENGRVPVREVYDAAVAAAHQLRKQLGSIGSPVVDQSP